jgi:hypothetical protein
MAKRKTKEELEIELHWNLMVKIFFEFYKQNFSGEKPSFDGSAPRDLKNIVLAIKKRAEDKGAEWTPVLAEAMIVRFLEVAYSDLWVRDNFMLHILNRKKDAIFIKIIQTGKNGNNTSATGNGQQGRIEALRNW